MKMMMIGTLCFCSMACLANGLSLSEVRALYERSVTEKKSCEQLINLLGTYTPANNPLFSGYRAAAMMVRAKYAINPFNKLSTFKKGKILLESAIKADHTNVELRFLRLGIQTNAPSFLGYSRNIQTDRSFLLQSIKQLPDLTLARLIASYLARVIT